MSTVQATQSRRRFDCLDPKDLNNSLEWEPYYSRSINELIAKFSGAVIFTIVNMDKGY